MEFNRDLYLQKLISASKNDMIKIVTGIRRCGKSYLLFEIFRNYLLSQGVKEDHIIGLAMDDISISCWNILIAILSMMGRQAMSSWMRFRW